MGRVNLVTYPSESQSNVCDESTWKTTSRSFVKVASAEYGIAAGHWRLTESTGNGKRLTYFDALWRPLLVREYDADNVADTQRFQRFEYDHEGRKTFESYHGTSDALSLGKRTTYDELGRVTLLEVDSELPDEDAVLETKTEYLSGFRTKVTDARGASTTTGYLTFDQPKEDLLVSITHPEGAFTSIVRDAYGKALSIKRRNGDGTLSAERTYAYNSNHLLCAVVEPETGATLTGYDGAGNVKWTAAGLPRTQQCEPNGTSTAVANRRVDRTYDGRNRVRTLVFPDGAGNQAWTYTLDGQPKTVSVSNPKVTQPTLTTFEYFRRGLPKSESVKIQDSSYAVTWGYTGNGHLATQIYPSGLSIGYLPNALGQPTQAGAYATDVRYYPNGAIKSFTYGNGVVHTMEQNARQLPSRSTDCKVAGTCAVADMRLDLSYTYDRAGNVATITDGLYGRQNRTMKYDGLGRLTSADSPMFGEALYTYNVLDDITQISVSGGTSPRNHHLCYDSATRRLTTLRTGSCTGTIVRNMSYDVQGNVTTNGAQSYTFDFGNRLREAPGKEWYAYDGFGHRVVSCETADCAHFFYSSKGQLLYTHDVRNNKRVDHIQLGNSLVALRERPIGSTSPTAKYQHTDMLGTPIAVTNSTQAFITKHEYEAYGQLVNGTLQDGPGYTGHVQDTATGLTYMQQRYYDPLVGRFSSVDPIRPNLALATHFNRYSYAKGNPLGYVDPDGNAPFAFLVKLLDNGEKVVVKALPEKAHAVEARRRELNVVFETQQKAKQVEVAAHGRENLIRDKGHDLDNGNVGLPHYQTDGRRGHSFWSEGGGVLPELLEAILIPVLATPSSLAPGTLYGPGTPYSTREEYMKSIPDKGSYGTSSKDPLDEIARLGRPFPFPDRKMDCALKICAPF